MTTCDICGGEHYSFQHSDNKQPSNEDLRLYAIARKVTDEVCGAGSYDSLNPRLKELADAGDALIDDESIDWAEVARDDRASRGECWYKANTYGAVDDLYCEVHHVIHEENK